MSELCPAHRSTARHKYATRAHSKWQQRRHDPISAVPRRLCNNLTTTVHIDATMMSIKCSILLTEMSNCKVSAGSQRSTKGRKDRSPSTHPLVLAATLQVQARGNHPRRQSQQRGGFPRPLFMFLWACGCASKVPRGLRRKACEPPKINTWIFFKKIKLQGGGVA